MTPQQRVDLMRELAGIAYNRKTEFGALVVDIARYAGKEVAELTYADIDAWFEPIRAFVNGTRVLGEKEDLG